MFFWEGCITQKHFLSEFSSSYQRIHSVPIMGVHLSLQDHVNGSFSKARVMIMVLSFQQENYYLSPENTCYKDAFCIAKIRAHRWTQQTKGGTLKHWFWSDIIAWWTIFWCLQSGTPSNTSVTETLLLSEAISQGDVGAVKHLSPNSSQRLPKTQTLL